MVAPVDRYPRQPRFLLGRRLATPGAIRAMEEAGQDPLELFDRHEAGDWGEIWPEDRRLNEAALENADSVMSVYVLPDGVRVWVITDGGRCATTIMLPSEY